MTAKARAEGLVGSQVRSIVRNYMYSGLYATCKVLDQKKCKPYKNDSVAFT